MDKISQLEIRERYMQLSRQLLLATEEGRPEAELKKIADEIKALEPVLTDIECCHPPDCP